MILLGAFAILLAGISLGLIGGGGSIMTVPILVYLFQIDAVTATGYSLLIVGLTAAIGAASYVQQNLPLGLLFLLLQLTHWLDFLQIFFKKDPWIGLCLQS